MSLEAKQNLKISKSNTKSHTISTAHYNAISTCKHQPQLIVCMETKVWLARAHQKVCCSASPSQQRL